MLTGVALFWGARRHVCNYIDGLLTSKTVAHKWFCDIRHAREIRYRQLQVFSGLKTMRNLMGNWVRFHPILSTARTIKPQKIDTSKTSCMLTASSECSFKVNLRVNCNRWIVNLSLQRRTWSRRYSALTQGRKRFHCGLAYTASFSWRKKRSFNRWE